MRVTIGLTAVASAPAGRADVTEGKGSRMASGSLTERPLQVTAIASNSEGGAPQRWRRPTCSASGLRDEASSPERPMQWLCHRSSKVSSGRVGSSRPGQAFHLNARDGCPECVGSLPLGIARERQRSAQSTHTSKLPSGRREGREEVIGRGVAGDRGHRPVLGKAFDDARITHAIEAIGRKKLIFAGISLELGVSRHHRHWQWLRRSCRRRRLRNVQRD